MWRDDSFHVWHAGYQSKRHETELSKHIFTLKDNNKPFNLKWKIIEQCKPYKNSIKKCNLCLFAKKIQSSVHVTEGTELGGIEGAETGFPRSNAGWANRKIT